MPRLPGPCARHPWFTGNKQAPVDCIVCRNFRKVILDRQAAK